MRRDDAAPRSDEVAGHELALSVEAIVSTIEETIAEEAAGRREPPPEAALEAREAALESAQGFLAAFKAADGVADSRGRAPREPKQ